MSALFFHSDDERAAAGALALRTYHRIFDEVRAASGGSPLVERLVLQMVVHRAQLELAQPSDADEEVAELWPVFEAAVDTGELAQLIDASEEGEANE